jgi:hypothetical protein
VTETIQVDIETRTASRSRTFASLRLLIAAAALVAIVSTFIDTASRVAINPFNFFGYFTMQSNIIITVVLLLAAYAAFARNERLATSLVLARACATTYIVIVGIVYNTLLVGLPGGISLEWANRVLHVALPAYAALDWILFGDRIAVPWRRLWIVVIFPIVWIAVVLVRGATDGWVPYPFLDRSHGYGVVALYCVGIAVATVVVAVGIWSISRLQISREKA